MAIHQNEFLSTEWSPWVNESSYDCPALGVFAIQPTDEPPEGTVSKEEAWISKGGTLYLRGSRANYYTVERESADFLRVNSAVSVKAGGEGECSNDWPLWALIDPKIKDDIKPGLPCGPIDDSWTLHPAGGAFLCVGKSTSHKGAPLARIVPNTLHAPHAIAATAEGLTVAPADYLFPTGLTAVTEQEVGGIPSWSRAAFEVSGPAIKVVRAGSYVIDISASLTLLPTSSTELAIPASIQIHVERGGAETATPYVATETWLADRDKSGAVTNRPSTVSLAVTGPMRLRAGDQVFARYVGSEACTMDCGVFVVRLRRGGAWQRETPSVVFRV